MGELQVSKAGDVVQSATPNNTVPEPDLSWLLGDWINTHATTRCIERFSLRRHGSVFYVQASGKDSPIGWDEVKVAPHADSVESGRAVAFLGSCEFGFMTTTLAANYNKGIIIVAAYSTFTDGSPRRSYFTREFFYHDDGTDGP